MVEKPLSYYHDPRENGFWRDKPEYTLKRFTLKGNVILEGTPVGFEIEDNKILMKLLTREGETRQVPIDEFLGLNIVEGDSKKHPHEINGEPLIEFKYLKKDNLEKEPRRVRPTGIMFGIYGGTEEGGVEKGVHRALGENADFYLEGIDTQYDPKKDGEKGLRRFPFWRIGVYGDPEVLAKEYLPQPPER
ncbi:hypothetical protein H3C65_00190 [Patescibacteria group bacterium]|nr:hypothetical protein [Patescibacteria group bacterium]